MRSEFGNFLRFAVEGESHGACVAGEICGFPAGFKIDKEKVANKTINRTIRIKQDTFNKLMELSEGNGISFNKVVVECIEYALSHM